MTVQVFARLRELIGSGEVEIAAPDGTTAGELRPLLAARWPAAAGVIEKSLVAVGNEYVGDEYVIPPAGAVALIPPVSGG